MEVALVVNNALSCDFFYLHSVLNFDSKLLVVSKYVFPHSRTLGGKNLVGGRVKCDFNVLAEVLAPPSLERECKLDTSCSVANNADDWKNSSLLQVVFFSLDLWQQVVNGARSQ